jgi:hypothetical protein
MLARTHDDGEANVRFLMIGESSAACSNIDVAAAHEHRTTP